MTKEDLIPLKKAGDAYSDKVRSKRKGSSSDKRKIAQRISGLKRASPKTIKKRCMELIADPNASALHIMQYIQAIKQNPDLEPSEQIQLVGKLINAHTAIHGSKARIQSDITLRADSAESMQEIYQIVNGRKNTVVKKGTKQV